MKKTFLIISYCLMLFASSCDYKLPFFTSQKPVNVICLVDFSSSIPEQTIASYKDIIVQNVNKHLENNDKLLVLPIDYASQTSSTEIFAIDYSKHNFEKEFASPQQKEQLEKKALDSFKDSISKKIDSSFNNAVINRQQYSGGTDIIGALKECRKYILDNSINLIVILSDMIQETDKIKLPDLKADKDIVNLVEKTDKVDLGTIDLLVLTGDQPGLPQTQFDKTKLFWSKYFDKCGLNLVDYSSGGRSVLSEKLAKYHSVKN